MSSTDAQQYRVQVAELRAALETGKPYLPLELQKQGYEILNSIEKRLDLGVDHTIVALAGGTGSGKSSTFNALSGLEFADVGVLRPTTARVASCTWSSDATALLDWLEVDSDRRISRDTALDGEDQRALHGMILLDLPDHDSVAEHHRTIVDKVLPLVDVLMWIVDPQKYADEALHAGYLRGLVGTEASMIVVLNQVDTIPEQGRETLVDDIARLLEKDGLDKVEIRGISARTGDGIADLREDLRSAVSRRTMASRRLRDELVRLARLIGQHVPGGVATDLHATARAEADRYLVASGIPALADDVSERTAQGRSVGEAPHISVASPSAVNTLRGRWIERVTAHMRSQWAKAVSAAAGESDELSAGLEKELGAVEVPWGPVAHASRVPAIVAWSLAAVLALLGVAALVEVVFTIPLGVVLLGVAVVSALVGFAFAQRRARILRRAGRARAEALRDAAAEAVSRVLDEVLFIPVAKILQAHDTVQKHVMHVSAPQSPAHAKPVEQSVENSGKASTPDDAEAKATV
ncbi:ABC transporter [Timonella sp. A28]|uniref:ABC transporter n=1 Tax=Timonella sp. A28 TaxID=3442640 RepID=UPI003EBAB76C